MAVNKAYLLDIASEFSDVDTTRVDRLVAMAALQAPSSKFGAKTDVAVAYLVAHMLKMDQSRGQGAVTSERVGNISRSFAARDGGVADELDQTAYGREFKRIRRMCVGTQLVT